MFDRAKRWVRGVVGRMFNFMEISDVTPFKPITSKCMTDAISLWMNMYVNNAPWVSNEVVSLNLPSFIAAEFARMTTIEMKSSVSGKVGDDGDLIEENSRGAFLNAQYQPVVEEARRFTEYAAAGGSLVLKPFLDDNGGIGVEYVRAGMFWPTAYSASGEITGCSFIDRITREEKVYTRVEHHKMERGGCKITNTAYVSDTDSLGREHAREIPLTSVEEWAKMEPEVFLPDLERPLFAVLNMPLANTIDPSEPLSVSVYARAVALIEEADKQFSRLLWEMESGNRALYVDFRAFRMERMQDGDLNPGNIPFKRFYRSMRADPTKDNSLFEGWSPELRDTSQLNALDAILRRIEDVCGLSRGTISEAPESNAGGAKTATELKIMRQRTYATVRDTQKALEKALRQLLWAMDKWATLADLAPQGDYDVSFEFDDSVMTDRGTEFMERMQLVTMGAMEPWEVRAWYLGETEEMARRNVSSIGPAPILPEE